MLAVLLLAAVCAAVNPPALVRNGLIGWPSPAGIVAKSIPNLDTYRARVAALSGVLETRYEFPRHAFDEWYYLAGTDANRAADINDLFANHSFSGIISNRGGWGCARLLDIINFNSIRENQKIIMGYSDLTALLNPITHVTNLVTFHGYMGVDNWDNAYTVQQTRDILFGLGSFPYVQRNPVSFGAAQTVKGGKARGKLMGGNLSVFTTILPSQYMPNAQQFSDVILFLEEVTEEPYVVDRYLTNLKQAGILANVQGLIFGVCTRCVSANNYSMTWQEVVIDHFSVYQKPSILNFMVGHGLASQHIMPIGATVELDADAGTLTILESPVNRV